MHFILLNMNLDRINNQNNLEDFIRKLEDQGFQRRYKPQNQSENSKEILGYDIIVDNLILAYSIRDCSFLHLNPKIICQPRTVSQLQKILQTADILHIPLTFASGKTGLSGGFATSFVLVDLEKLVTQTPSIIMDVDSYTIQVDQSILVSKLIRYVPLQTKNRFIFPCQPSSAFKLPVRIGGLIGTNASGITSGKLGPIYDWIDSMQILLPTGEIRTVHKMGNPSEHNLFNRIIGGMGLYGVILNAKIRLARASDPQDLTHFVLFGDNFDFIFEALQEIQNQKIFPLNCEFILSTTDIPGKFKELSQNKPIRWAILLKDTKNITTRFSNVVSSFGNISKKKLDVNQYKNFLDERTGLAIQTKSNDPSQEFIRFPGFEDILMPPNKLKKVLDEINTNLVEFEFPPIIIGYGHLNFRKGQGLLLHVRIPVNVSDFASNSRKMYGRIAKLTAKMNYILEQKFHIRPKAEHSTGVFTFWHQRYDLQKIIQIINNHQMIISPHLISILQICRSKGININETFPDNQSEAILETLLQKYLTN